jgi:DNA mismatch endonuclease, patch repair protein
MTHASPRTDDPASGASDTHDASVGTAFSAKRFETDTSAPADAPIDPLVSRRMSNTRSRDTAPEIAVRRLLHSRGLRYRVNTRPIPNLRRTADIVFTKARVAILIDGCFWHGCAEHHRPAHGPRTEFWASKIADNRRRDVESTKAFEAAGWCVLRFWEHEEPTEVAWKIASIVSNRNNRPRSGR